MAFCHRMIDLLGFAALPPLPAALAAVVSLADARELAELTQLLHNALSRLKAGSGPLLAPLLPLLLDRSGRLLPPWLLRCEQPPAANGHSPGGGAGRSGAPSLASEEARELLELQRVLVGFCAALAACEPLLAALLAQQVGGQATLAAYLSMLFACAAGHADVLVRKAALAALTRVVHLACPAAAAEAPAGPQAQQDGTAAAAAGAGTAAPDITSSPELRRMCVAQYGVECCLAPLIRGDAQYDPKDANGAALLGEVAAGHVLLAQRCGQAWLDALQASGLLVAMSAHFGPQAGGEFLRQVGAGDARAVRGSLRALLERVRQAS